jgi:hypothetical protein
MLIPYSNIAQFCRENSIDITGIFHLGAHECEELNDYVKNGVKETDIVWVEGNKEIYERMKGSVSRIINEVVDEVSGREVSFNITNNGQSSSILDLGTHEKHHPQVFVVKTEKHITKNIKDIVEEYKLDFSKYNFWNFDIQGAELRALRGAGDLLNYAKLLYLEVNTEKVYKDCALIEEIDEYVAKFGFKRVSTCMTPYNWGDELYVK